MFCSVRVLETAVSVDFPLLSGPSVTSMEPNVFSAAYCMFSTPNYSFRRPT